MFSQGADDDHPDDNDGDDHDDDVDDHADEGHDGDDDFWGCWLSQGKLTYPSFTERHTSPSAVFRMEKGINFTPLNVG